MSAKHFDTLRMIEDIATTLGNQNKLTHKGAIYHAKVEPDKDIWRRDFTYRVAEETCGSSYVGTATIRSGGSGFTFWQG